MKIALVAGTNSGCGKTTLTLALLQYLKGLGRAVAACKCGPDFLDPAWHRAVIGRPSYNLDTEMIGRQASLNIVADLARSAEWAVIEGVMGLFDGRGGVGSAGSAADLARVLEVPVILVVDAAGIAGSIVPMVAGFRDYAARMGVTICGVIGNRVGSAGHADLLRNALQEHGMPPLLAWMGKNAPVLGERHLGLVAPEESEVPDFSPFLQVDAGKLIGAFADLPSRSGSEPAGQGRLAGKTIAIASDDACRFIYQANLDWLRAEGAESRYFSLLAGEPVPADADALWLPGGYPELHAEQLSRSASLPSLRRFIEDAKPVLAECGGAMLLGNQLIDQTGRRWPMAGVLPYASRMRKELVGLGYRREANGARGHEFHYSLRETATTLPAAFDCPRGDRGVRYKNLRASYVHWYFSSAPEAVAEWFS